MIGGMEEGRMGGRDDGRNGSRQGGRKWKGGIEERKKVRVNGEREEWKEGAGRKVEEIDNYYHFPI